jgi:hypothetical protein
MTLSTYHIPPLLPLDKSFTKFRKATGLVAPVCVMRVYGDENI